MPTTTDPSRTARCRYHNRLDEPCPNPAIDDDPNTIRLCPAHALRAAQLLVEHGAITIKYANLNRRRSE